MADDLSAAMIRGSVAPRDLVSRVAHDPWLAGWWHRAQVTPATWAGYAEARALALVRGAQFAEVDEAIVGWRRLAFDSEALGVGAARVDVVAPPPADPPFIESAVRGDDAPSPPLGEQAVEAMAAALRRARANALADGAPHLVGRVDARALEKSWAFERAGFALVDGLLTFARRINARDADHAPPAPAGVTIRTAGPADADRIAAEATFYWDRFHADPVLPAGAADRLHATWVRNSCLGTAAHVVWVAEDEAGVLGFTTGWLDPLVRDSLGLPTVTLVLVATSARARRRGIARALAAHAIHWAAQEGLAAVEVGTQLRNIAAARTYESAGFRLVATSLTFRAWSGG
jgi:ribosomal protein S18 acetylase RimI-like enzyme